MRLFLLIVITWTLASASAHSQTKAFVAKEQTEFCEDGAPEDVSLTSIQLPQSVIAAVMNSKEGKQAANDALVNRSKFDPASLLTGQPIQLSTRQDKYFLVTGKGDLSGADNIWFWIVRQSGGKARSLGWFGANCVQINPTTTRGLKDIVTFWSSASATRTNTYKFDGESYRLVRSRMRNH